MRFHTRLAGIALTSAVALGGALGAGSANAAIPDMKLKPCNVKWILGPSASSLFDRGTDSGSGTHFDVENPTSDGSDPLGRDTVAHDDLSYDPC